MPRLMRNTAILAKIETTYGTDPVPTGSANALLVSNVSANPLVANNVSRELIRPYLGGSEQLIGTKYIELSFDVELQSSGSMVAPTVPAWGPLVRACGMAETATAGIRVEYNPISTAFESVTIYYFLDGVLRKLLGARGNLVIKMGVGERPVLSFAFKGLDGGVTATALPATTLTGFKTPSVITDANSGDVLLGCTYTAATPALTGGTLYPSRGLEIDLGNQVEFVPMLGSEAIDIINRQTTARVQFDFTAAQEVTFDASVKANTLQAIGLQHGATAGSKALVFAPAAQLISPSYQEFNGRVLMGFEARLVPSGGNDELKLVAA